MADAPKLNPFAPWLTPLATLYEAAAPEEAVPNKASAAPSAAWRKISPLWRPRLRAGNK